MCVCVCVYEGHLIKKGNFVKKSWQYETLFIIESFPTKPQVMNIFMS